MVSTLFEFETCAVSEYAYTLVQDLDPNSEGRGVLQFKTGLLSVIKVCMPWPKIQSPINLWVHTLLSSYISLSIYFAAQALLSTLVMLMKYVFSAAKALQKRGRED